LDSAKGGSGCLMPFLFLLVYVLGSCRTLKNTLIYIKKNIMVSKIIIVQLNKEEGKSRQPIQKEKRDLKT
jgi:hypothetical protein